MEKSANSTHSKCVGLTALRVRLPLPAQERDGSHTVAFLLPAALYRTHSPFLNPHYNTGMSRPNPNLVPWLLWIAVGAGLGLYVGWVVAPVEYVDTAPSSLQAVYKD